MAGSSEKKLMASNQAILSKYRWILLGLNALYVAYRVAFLWDTFSGWHAAGYALTIIVYAVCWWLFTMSAKPKFASVAEGGKLISAGIDLNQPGVMEYTWDIMYVMMFVQIGSGFISDWFWLFAVIPPSFGLYFLWIKVIYPWISKPDPEAQLAQEQQPGRNQRGVRQQKQR
uniref:Transmembrane protein 208 n=1 Tax=Haptolina brevifila TaxID=156173 RepID=A0A7S2DRR1_9EUKA|eukprot:CAMPEP_0174751252 /NCGR_PEP_ID=MMETSP1094-20130205/99410_1 /TAXON_ID=156173 /ORGANISM="Chrysochromulina brevifilum, Strain UTEX LB 985" /LENGTH=171 /DNA_ID=CAMNT_0015956715 /DNA_START=54 /DNA_END=569 /DNA_ORIENTATION=-